MKNPNNKKGQEGGPSYTMIALIAASLLLVFIFFWLGRSSGSVSEQTTAQLVEQKLEACKAKGERGQLDGAPYPDIRDGDGLPDFCDNCPDTPNFGEGVEDKDGDGFPFLPGNSNLKKVCCLTYKSLLGEKPVCEDAENDQKYGPKELILTYLNPKKS